MNMRRLVWLTTLISAPVWAADTLDVLGLEDLVNTEITSVSRKSQSLNDVPAAAFVVSAEDIRRSGASTLPDVLRMVPGIQVAQIDSGRYAVSSRGFNGRFANKLQVLVDGRSIYHPIFSGVLWESDAIALDDIERIEVIRGPGAAMWGANAVNGVINIISKDARSQQGSAVSATLGSERAGSLYVRQGGQLGEKSSWKISAQGRHAEPSHLSGSGAYTEDRLNNGVIDARFDHAFANGNDLSIWLNAIKSSLGDQWLAKPNFDMTAVPLPSYQGMSGIPVMQNYYSQTLMGRYRWISDSGIESTLQTGVTQSGIEVVNFIKEDRTTFDFDYQGRLSVHAHDLLWGYSHRTSSDDINTPTPLYLSMVNANYTQRSNGVFIHDDWSLIRDTLSLGIGGRWDHANRGGNTFSPNATLMWTPTRTDTAWLKYARSPRIPARAEQDVSVFNTVSFNPSSSYPIFIRSQPGNSPLKPEKSEGAEIGFRKQLTANLSADLAAFRYRYQDLRSGTLLGSPSLLTTSSGITYGALVQDVAMCNCQSGWMNGAELSVDWLATPAWRLQLSLSWLKAKMDSSDDRSVQGDNEAFEKSTPKYFGSLRSQWNIDSKQQFDAWLRGSSGYERLNAPFTDYVNVPGYLTLDLRYAYKIEKNLELALIGRNLVGGRRIEFVSDYLPSRPTEIVPSYYLVARWKY